MPTPPPPPPQLVTASPSPAPVVSASPSGLPSASPSTLGAMPATVALHPGGTATIAISGSTGAITVTLAQSLVNAAVDQNARSIALTAGTRTGTDVAHVTDASGASIDVPVRVAQDAGTIPATLTLKVTGSPIDPTWLASQIVAFVTRNLVLQPGTAPSIASLPSPWPPAPNASSTVSVPVQIAGNDAYFDVGGTTNVTVQNIAVEPFAPAMLFYDDDPERIIADGLVYRGTITAQTPASLYYYHDGGSEPRRLAVILNAQAPTSVQVIDASAGPNVDVMSVGHTVSKDFLAQDALDEGTIVDLAAATPYLLDDFALTSKAGVAGSVAMQVLSGGPVTVSVVAYSPGANPLGMLDAPPTPPDGHHRTGVFTLANYGTQSLAYAAGGDDAKAVYGDRDPTPPSTDPAATGHDFGDYGVVRTFLFSLTNPTEAPATVYLYERPLGGIVRSSFLVDGRLVEVGCVRLSVPYQIQAFELAPGGKYQVNVQTMTDGGSSYPLEIGMTATAPQATAPPISGPDGCFPKP